MDKVIQCGSCKDEFIWSSGEQIFYKKKGFHTPKRCKACRKKEKDFEATRRGVGLLQGEELKWAESLLGYNLPKQEDESLDLGKDKMLNVKENRLEKEAYEEGLEAKKSATEDAKFMRFILLGLSVVGVFLVPFVLGLDDLMMKPVVMLVFASAFVTVLLSSMGPASDEVWVNHGKMAGAEGEDVVLRALADLEGNFLVFNQLEVPCAKSKTGFVELDVVVLHEAGLHVIEVKNHRGTISGKEDAKYLEHIKISSSGYSYCNEISNPLLQLKFQIKALKLFLRESGLNTLVDGHVVFSNEGCTLDIASCRSIKSLEEINMSLFPVAIQLPSSEREKLRQILSGL